LRLLTEEHLANLEEPQAPATLAARNNARWDLLDECRLAPNRPASGSDERTSDRQVSTTDPVAVAMRTHGERAAIGYHTHYVIDGGTARIILNARVTPADVRENAPMLPLLRRARFRWRVKPKRVIADTTYGTADHLREIERSGFRAYVPLPDWDQRTAHFGPSLFTYDPGADVSHCPQGATLRRGKAHHTTRHIVLYRADAAVCNACPVKASCTASDHGRQIARSFDADYLERVRGYHGTEEYKQAMRKRKVWIEPLFGEAKQWHGLRQFRLRRLMKVNMEGLLIAAGQNLKRLLRARGWGWRPWPDGAAGLAGMLLRAHVAIP
jgi:hypothetical protein